MSQRMNPPFTWHARLMSRRRPRYIWMSIGAAFASPVLIMIGFTLGRLL